MEMNIETRVRQVIADELGMNVEDIIDDKAFVADLGCDSLDGIELIMAVEDELDIEIQDEDAEKLLTVKNVIDYVLHKKTYV